MMYDDFDMMLNAWIILQIFDNLLLKALVNSLDHQFAWKLESLDLLWIISSCYIKMSESTLYLYFFMLNSPKLQHKKPSYEKDK